MGVSRTVRDVRNFGGITFSFDDHLIEIVCDRGQPWGLETLALIRRAAVLQLETSGIVTDQ